MNCMEREVELYKRERDIILSDTTLDEALVLSLEQRRKAFEESVSILSPVFFSSFLNS